jgi:hypothetical protein
MTKTLKKQLGGWGAVLGIVLATAILPTRAAAQDQDDPPTRVARLGYMEGSVSFQPAGTDDWVGAVPNRPMTTGDQLWSDSGSRAELQLGSAVIRLSENTGVTFLNLDDHTLQVQLSSGTINVRVRRLREDDDFEIDTPNLAFTITDRGNYRVQASADGSYTIVSVRAGDGEATGSGQSYSLQAGQVGYFDGTDSLNADVEPIDEPDQFDVWVDGRDHRYDSARSAQYMSADVVGFEDMDDYGDWRDDSNYGHIWFPNQIQAGWAPYHQGHWDWIDPWGYTWVDDSPWGYAPFHYGRWVFVAGRWGWIAGPPAQPPVYAPALVVFIGGGGGWGGNIGWFALGPREVYVPTYPVSQTYMTQINVSSTTVSTTVVTNVYNTTIINKTTNITNVTYANKSVPGAVTAVPQGAFAGAQPVAAAAVKVTPQQIAAAPVSAHVAVNPTRESVLGAKASSAGHVTAPPAAIRNRQVVAKKTPPPPPVTFAKKQAAMAAHPGQPLPRAQLASLRPAAAARPAVKVAPPAKPAKPTTGNPAAAAARHGQPAPAARPGQPAPSTPAKQPPARPGNAPAPVAHPAAPAPAQPSHPAAEQPKQPEANRPPAAQPNKPEANRPPAAQPSKPEESRPSQPAARPEPKPSEPAARPPASEHTEHTAPPAAAKPAAPPPAAAKPAPAQKPPAKPLTPEEKKQEEERQKKEQQKPPGE